REVSVDFGGPFKLRMTHQRADFDVSVLDRNCAKAGDGIEVDQQGRAAKPHVECGDQALAAGEQARILGAEQLDGMPTRARLRLGERGRLHVLPPSLIFLYCRCPRWAVNPCRREAGW